jgi:hypothetical protein
MASPKFRRRRRIIKPRLQLKLVAGFVGVSALGFLLQYLLLAKELTAFADTLPVDGARLLAATPGILAGVLAISFGILFPLTFVVGVLMTFRVAGPIYRFEQYLGAIARGEIPKERCRIRDGDELWELCETINDAVATLRADGVDARPHSADPDKRELRRAG